MLKKLEHRFPGLKEVTAEADYQAGFVIQTSQTRTSRNTEGLTSTTYCRLRTSRSGRKCSRIARSFEVAETGGERQSTCGIFERSWNLLLREGRSN